MLRRSHIKTDILVLSVLAFTLTAAAHGQRTSGANLHGSGAEKVLKVSLVSMYFKAAANDTSWVRWGVGAAGA
jgi:hypothetical protein